MTNARPVSTAAHAAGLVRAAIPRLHPGGHAVIAGIAGGFALLRVTLRTAGLRRAARLVGRVGTLTTAASALFFRVPERVPPTDPLAVVAPADGVVAQLTTAAPPPETGLDARPRTRVSIFLSLLDVHAQWVPVTGSVRAVHYHPGAFFSADLDKASEANERNSVVIAPAAAGAPGSEVVVTQIAGLLARRIVCDLAEYDEVRAGDLYGLIRFGSRLDVYLPADCEPAVRVGQRAVGAETVLARLPEGSAG